MIVVEVTGGAVGVLPGVVVTKVIDVPFLRPLTTGFASDPRKELKSLLILSTTWLSPRFVAKVFMRDASVLSADVVSANAWTLSPNARVVVTNIDLIFIDCFPPFIDLAHAQDFLGL
jgi:hypothetical protein